MTEQEKINLTLVIMLSFILLVIFTPIYLSYKECNKKGGDYVRGAMFYKCINKD